MSNVIQFPAEDPGVLAQRAAVERLHVLWDLLEQENDGVDIDWAETPAMAPFCGCTDCVVREVLHAGVESLRESGIIQD